MLIFLTEKNGEAPCAYFSYVLNFFEVQRVHVLIFHVLIKKGVYSKVGGIFSLDRADICRKDARRADDKGILLC